MSCSPALCPGSAGTWPRGWPLTSPRPERSTYASCLSRRYLREPADPGDRRRSCRRGRVLQVRLAAHHRALPLPPPALLSDSVSTSSQARDAAGTAGSGVQREPGSFRDPASTVFYLDGRVLRGLDGEAAAEWRALQDTRFFPRLLEQGKVCPTEQVPAPSGDGTWALVLEHERIPFVSYPYEWTFSMLRDAALLHLDILLDALDEGVTMKDGYAYNVQWRGTKPVFIDVVSFERLRGGEPWAGYRQFCQTFLYPLLLQAYKGVAFQHLHRRGARGQGRLRRAGAGRRAPRARLGPRLQRRHLRPHRRRARRQRGRGRRRRLRHRRPLPAPARRGRGSHPAAGDEPDRPVARDRLARQGARAVLRARPPRERFNVERRLELPSGTRTLYAAVPRG